MKTILSVVLCLLTIGGCTKKDVEAKTDAENFLEQYKKQVEKERAIAAYQNTPEYKEKLTKALSRYDVNTKDIKVP